MITVNEIRDFIEVYYLKGNGSHYKEFFCPLSQNSKISMQDESLLETLVIQFSPYPVDNDEEAEIWDKESKQFEEALIEYLNDSISKRYSPFYSNNAYSKLEPLNNNHHYMANWDGDTIQVHFNDESLFIISTWTGQY